MAVKDKLDKDEEFVLTELIIPGRRNNLSAIYHLPEGISHPAWVVTCHGLFSYKDSFKWKRASELFTSQGLAVLRFDFSGCGQSQGAVEETTVSGRLADLEAVLRFMEKKGWASRLALMGSSLGGVVAVLAAARDKRIKALVTLATPFYLPQVFGLHSGQRQQPQGQKLNLKESFWQDLPGHDMAGAASQLSCPLLVIHGSRDELVPAPNAYALYEKATGPKRLEMIEGADHAISDPGHLEQVLETSLEWFKRYW